ncbi:MAG: hypothetical protein PVI30_06615 [Myxococcales bacterium]|jgi:hypothetical protein
MSGAQNITEQDTTEQNTTEQSGHEPASPQAQPEQGESRRGLESDVHRLIDAMSGLAEATARPVASALKVVADNVGGREPQPRVRFHNLEQTGTELLTAAVRLAENVASLSLQALGVQSEAGSTQGQAGRLPRAEAGGSLRIPLSIENPSAHEMHGLRFEAEPMRGPDDGSGMAEIAAERVRLQPEVLDIAPGDFEKLSVQVDVPSDARLGTYAGALRLQGDEAFRVPVRFEVVAPAASRDARG